MQLKFILLFIALYVNTYAQVENSPKPLITANEIPNIQESEIPEAEIDVGDLIRSGLLEGEPTIEESVEPNSFTQFENFLGKQSSQVQQDKARVRILTFNTNNLDDRTLTINQPYQFEGMEVILRGCRANVENIPGNDMAWVDVLVAEPAEASSLQEENIPQTLLSGWILSQYTDAHTLEHPKYDIRLLKCQA